MKRIYFAGPSLLKIVAAGLVCLSPLLSTNWVSVLAQTYGGGDGGDGGGDAPMFENPNDNPARANFNSTFEAVGNACPALATADPASLTQDQQQFLQVCTDILNADPNRPQLTQAQQTAAFNALTGDELAAPQTNSNDIANVQMRNVAGRLRAIRGGAGGISVTGLGFGSGESQIAAAALQSMLENVIGGAAGEAGLSSRWGLFINGNLSFGEKDDTLLEAGFDFDTFGVTAGVDYRFSNNLFGGIAIGYGSSESDFFSNGGDLESDGYTLSAFTSYYRDALYLDAIVNYGTSEHDSDRRIFFDSQSGAINNTASGSTDGTQRSLGLETGLNLENGGWTFSPNLSLFYSDVDIDSFRERGSALGLAFSDQGIESLTLGAGLAAVYSYSTEWGVLRPQLRADFIREMEDDAQIINFRFLSEPFANDPSAPVFPWPLKTDAPDKDYFLLGIGVSAQFRGGVSGFVDWQSLQGYNDLQVDSVTFGLRWEAAF